MSRQVLKGDKHPNWKGGRRRRNGYIQIWNPKHPFTDSKGYVMEHRLVYEQYYNCCLLPWSIIHHINEIKTDNRIENLEPLLNQGEHISIHNRKDMTGRTCLLCGSNTTHINKRGCPCWFRYENISLICKKCYDKQRSINRNSKEKMLRCGNINGGLIKQ